MSDTSAKTDSDEPQPLDDPSGFGPEDIAGHGPVTSAPSGNETPSGAPGDADNHADPEDAPSS